MPPKKVNQVQERPVVKQISERVSFRRVKELLTSNIFEVVDYSKPVKGGEYKERYSQEDWKVNDFRTLFEMYQHSGVVERRYKHSESDKEGNGRIYCSRGLQLLSRHIRGWLCQDDFVDIDVVNCHPQIVKQMMEDADYQAPMFFDYCNNRSEWLKDYKEINLKVKIIAQINDTKLYKFKDTRLNSLFEELFTFVNTQERPFCNQLFKRENELINKICQIAKRQKVNVNAVVFDGIIVDKTDGISKFIEVVNRDIAPFKVVNGLVELYV